MEPGVCIDQLLNGPFFQLPTAVTFRQKSTWCEGVLQPLGGLRSPILESNILRTGDEFSEILMMVYFLDTSLLIQNQRRLTRLHACSFQQLVLQFFDGRVRSWWYNQLGQFCTTFTWINFIPFLEENEGEVICFLFYTIVTLKKIQLNRINQ